MQLLGVRDGSKVRRREERNREYQPLHLVSYAHQNGIIVNRSRLKLSHVMTRMVERGRIVLQQCAMRVDLLTVGHSNSEILSRHALDRRSVEFGAVALQRIAGSHHWPITMVSHVIDVTAYCPR